METREGRWLIRLSKPATVMISVAVLCIIGVGDYATGVDVNFTLFYLVPVFVVTWNTGVRGGVFTSLFCAVVWAIVDYVGRPALHIGNAIWNISFQFGIFVSFSVALSRILDGITKQKMLNDDIRAALAEVKTLSGILPICAWCKKIRDEDGQWTRLESYIASHSDADFTHGICPECARNRH